MHTNKLCSLPVLSILQFVPFVFARLALPFWLVASWGRRRCSVSRLAICECLTFESLREFCHSKLGSCTKALQPHIYAIPLKINGID